MDKLNDGKQMAADFLSCDKWPLNLLSNVVSPAVK